MLFAAQHSVAQEETAESKNSGIAKLLAQEFIRTARLATMTEPLDTLSIMSAVYLVKEAAKLSPHDPNILRSMIEVAQMADLPELKQEGIQKLLKISPKETPLQLARLRGAIDKTNTADNRISVYEQLLGESNYSGLDSRIASRLALDVALLQRQLGNTHQFARWLAESVALDPANSEAMVLAVGFFGDETADVLSRVELLSAAMLSNLRDTTLQVSLAELLMAYGDYSDANSIYQIVLSDKAGDETKLSDGLLADIALCQWAAGDGVSALDSILSRQIAVDKRYRDQTSMLQPRLTPLELARIHAPLVPKLATVRAAIYADQDDKSIAASTLDSAIGSITTAAQIYESRGTAYVDEVLNLYLQAAWVSVWLGSNTSVTESIVGAIEEGATINHTEKTRFDGWIALRNGDIDTAIELLSSINEDEPAKAGLGLAYLKLDKKQEAAKLFLEIAKTQGETILGVWSRNQLKEIVGTEFDIRPEVTDLKKLMVGVLQTMDDYVSDPRSAIGVYVNSDLKTYSPYEPIHVSIELTNNTTVPLSIAKNGPIQPILLIESRVQIPGFPEPLLKPIIVPINQQLSIMPRESMTVNVNLRQFWVGQILNMFPLSGASLKISATVNFMARETVDMTQTPVLVYEVGEFGSRDELDGIRVDGVRLNDVWLKEAISKATEAKTDEDIVYLVLLTWIVGDDVKFAVETPLIPPPPGEEETPEMIGNRLKLQNDAITTVLTVFPRLSKTSQAWVVSTMSDDPSIEAVLGMFKEPDSVPAQLSWLIRFTEPDVPDEALDDARILDAMSSENKVVNTVANWVYSYIKQIAEKRKINQLGSRPAILQ
jgi:tetratricopeptide (TPR) repeat protein